jgi:hypothetical protein
MLDLRAIRNLLFSHSYPLWKYPLIGDILAIIILTIIPMIQENKVLLSKPEAIK